MANFWGGWTPPRHSGTWAGARVASLRCHYPPPRRSQYSRNAEAQPHKSKTSCRGGHRRGTTTSGPGCGPLAGFEVTLYGRFWGDRRGRGLTASGAVRAHEPPRDSRALHPAYRQITSILRVFVYSRLREASGDEKGVAIPGIQAASLAGDCHPTESQDQIARSHTRRAQDSGLSQARSVENSLALSSE